MKRWCLEKTKSKRWALRLLPALGYCKVCCSEHWGARMELESIMLSEISQAVKDKYHMISPIRGT